MTEQVWIPNIYDDYSGALIRLATVVEKRIQRLVFAWVEFYPHEVALPPSVQEQKQFGPFTIRYSVTPVSCDEALAWYSNAAAGALGIPNLPAVKVEPVRLSPEPASGRLVVGADIPFEPPWHGGARLHRLVNLADAEASVGAIAVPGDNPERWEKARAWLADRLQFDVLASDAWIGSCALLAPNPKGRGSRHRLVNDSATGKTLVQVRANLRSRTKPDGLTIRFVERRVGGWSHTSERPLDAFGSVEVELPEPVDQIGYDLFDSELGHLEHNPATPLISEILTDFSVSAGTVSVQVPSPKSTGSPTTYTRPITQHAGTSTIGKPMGREGLIRLRKLVSRQGRRTGSSRPGGQQGTEDAHIFLADRDHAAIIIRDILSRAKKRVVFVDPYFDEVALREFALAIPERSVQTGVLTNYRPDRREDGGSVGQRLHDEVIEVTKLLEEKSLGSLDVRASRGTARKYHDRFLLVDDDVWHCGHSFNQVGRGPVTAMTRLRRPEVVKAMIEEDFAAAEPFGSAHGRWLAEQKPQQKTWKSAIATLLRGWAAKLDGRA